MPLLAYSKLFRDFDAIATEKTTPNVLHDGFHAFRNCETPNEPCPHHRAQKLQFKRASTDVA